MLCGVTLCKLFKTYDHCSNTPSNKILVQNYYTINIEICHNTFHPKNVLTRCLHIDIIARDVFLCVCVRVSESSVVADIEE